MGNILIIDDEINIRELLQDILEDEGHTVYISSSGEDGFKTLEINPINLIFLDVWLGDCNGIDLLKKIKDYYPNVEVIIISGHASIDDAVRSMKFGAFNVLQKPLSLDRVLSLTESALKKSDLDQNQPTSNTSDKIIGSSEEIKKVKKDILSVSKSIVSVFIEGENGVGKDLIAKEIHKISERSKNPFVSINCAAIPQDLIESELFGYKKGAFTGAMSDKKGKFELANHGTLFLDEIADLSLQAQAKILNVIESKTVTAIGSNKQIQLDIKYICATNKDMNEEIKCGRFRQDLYYRLYVFPIRCPPLRKRKQDIIEIAEYFLKTFCQKYKKNIILSNDVKTLLKESIWKGNVRELKNFVERMTVLYDGEVEKKQIEDILFLKDEKLDIDMSLSIKEAKDELEKQMILQALKDNNYNLGKTSKFLGIYPSSLSMKLKKYEIKI